MVAFNWTVTGDTGLQILAEVIAIQTESDVYFWLEGIQQKARGEYQKRTKFLLEVLSQANQRSLYQHQDQATLSDKTLMTGYKLLIDGYHANKFNQQLRALIKSIIDTTARLQAVLDANARQNNEAEALEAHEYLASSADAIQASLTQGRGKRPSQKGKRRNNDGNDGDDDDDDEPRPGNKRPKSTAPPGGENFFAMSNMIGGAIKQMTAMIPLMGNPLMESSSSSSSSSSEQVTSFPSTVTANVQPAFNSPLTSRRPGRDTGLVEFRRRTIDKLTNDFQIESIGDFLTAIQMPLNAFEDAGYTESDVADKSGDVLDVFISYLCALHTEGTNLMRKALIDECKLNPRNASMIISFFEKSMPSPVSL